MGVVQTLPRTGVSAWEQTLGRDVIDLLWDSEVLEVLLDSDGSTWTDRVAIGLQDENLTIQPQRAEAFLVTVAGLLGQELTRERPLLEGELPGHGARITGAIPPVVEAPAFAIRKRAESVYRLSDYVASRSLWGPGAEVLRTSLVPEDPEQDALNVVIAGGPGSGKTTLANALLAEIADALGGKKRLILIEDTYELQCNAPCHQPLRTAGTVDLRALVQVALRLRPDRIIVGEVRGAEALDMLKAWNTGTPGGVATVHANSAADALGRLDYLAQEANVPPQAHLVASAVDLVVFIVRTPQGRKVTEMVRVHGLDGDGGYELESLL